ncbi:MAG: GspH/FimT family protein [Parvularculaceae bacterium]
MATLTPSASLRSAPPPRAGEEFSTNSVDEMKRRQKGLTLVELLVVLVILALTAGAVMMTLPPRRSEVETHTRKLAAKLATASEQAVLSGRVIGVDFEEDSYEFRLYRDEIWQDFSAGDSLAGESFDEISITIKLDQIPVNQGVIGRDLSLDLDDAEDEATPKPPQIMFLATGDTAAVEISLRDHGQVWLISLSHLGKVEVTRDQ